MQPLNNERRHVFVFNEQDNGGEQLFLLTRFQEEDGSTSITQEFTLQSYCNSVSYNLGYLLTPQNLRVLANQLEAEKIRFETK